MADQVQTQSVVLGAEGAKDDMIAEMDRNLRIAINARSDWDKVAKEDIQFTLGDQWNPEDRAALESQGRPVLTFNKIKPLINLVCGHALQNNTRLQVVPEGGEDQPFSHVMDRAIDFIDKVSNLEFQLGYLRASGLRSGRSWIEFNINYEEDPIFGQLKTLFLGPFKVYPDPTAVEYDLSDAQYAFKIVQMTKGRLKQLYPSKKSAIDAITSDTLGRYMESLNLSGVEGGPNNYGVDKSVSSVGIHKTTMEDPQEGELLKLTVAEYWKKKLVDRWFVYFVESGSVENFKTEEEAQVEIQNRAIAAMQMGQQVQPPVTKKRKVTEMQLNCRAGDVLLESGVSPFEPWYHGFPFFQFIAEYAPDSDKEEYKVQSITRTLKDPQREINKSRSQYLHILNTSANSGWIGDEDALTAQQKVFLRQFGSTPGITIWKKPGSQLERIHPVEPSVANQVREQTASSDLKEVSGINSDLLAIDNNTAPSGKAIALRIRQAITILEPIFANFKYTKQLIGAFLFKIMPMMFDSARLMKVLGEKYMKENQLNPNDIEVFLDIVKDGKYNVSISESGSATTLREETFENLISLVEKGFPIPPDVIFEFMNIPNKQEVMQKVQAYQQQQQQAQIAMASAKQGGSQKPTTTGMM